MRRLDTLLCAIALLLLTGGCGTFDPSFGYLSTSSGGGGGTGGGGGSTGEGTVDFARDIRPIIALGPDAPERYGCRECHYSTEPKHVGFDLGGLDLSTLGALRRGGATSGTHIVVPGNPEASIIVQKLRGTYPFGEQMPRSGIKPATKWGDDEMALLTSWIEAGAEGADDE